MLEGAKVMGFIPTEDFAQAEAFYAGKLGLSLISRDDFALVFESGGTTIRVVKVGDFQAAGFTILGWQVADVPATVAAFQQRGLQFERYPWMKQDAAGIWSAPGGTKVAWFKDPAGNVLSLSSS